MLEAHPQFQEALGIVEKLRKAGFEALFAGGCVRDALLGTKAKDIDIATSAKPEDIEKLFEKTLGVGRAFGTMIVVGEHGNYETTTFRKDGPYLDGRHPTSVEFTDAEEDAKRRDFTINALFYDPIKQEVIDYVKGREDLAAKIIRTVGDANARFEEDHLRLLRAIRFSAQLGFDIEIETWNSIKARAATIATVSVERILQELLKLLQGPSSALGLERLARSGLATHVWPALAKLHEQPEEWQNFIARVRDIHDPAAVFAVFGIVTENRGGWLAQIERLKPPRQLTQSIQQLMQAHEILWRGNGRKSERVRLWAKPEWTSVLAMAEAEAQHRENGVNQLEQWISEFLQICDEKGNLPKPLMTGEDLVNLGFKPGPALGKTLEAIYRLQLEGQISSRSQAERLAQATLEQTSSGF